MVLTAYHLKIAFQWAVLIAGGLIAGFVLQAFAMPIPFFLGAFVVAIGFGSAGIRLHTPSTILIAVEAFVGCVIASTVNMTTLISLADAGVGLAAVTFLTLAATGLVSWLLIRFANFPAATAAWGFSPGAAAVMIIMGGQYGADVRIVALMQNLRLLGIVVLLSLLVRFGFDMPQAPIVLSPTGGLFTAPLIPFLETAVVALIGGVSSHYLKFPSAAVLIPLALGALLKMLGLISIAMPGIVIDAIYVILGCYVGMIFDKPTFFYAMRLMPKIVLGTGLMLAFCLAAGVGLTVFGYADPLTAFLATAPGGLDIVVLLAMGSHANVAFVTAAQTLRVTLVTMSAPSVARFLCRYQSAEAALPPS